MDDTSCFRSSRMWKRTHNASRRKWPAGMKYLVIFSSLLLLLCSVPGSESQDFSPPPVVWIERSWDIPENEPVGTRVAHAKPQDERTKVEFSLEPSVYLDGSSFFRIDPNTGAVYLNESMEGKRGKQYYLQVVASNGKVASKTEVWIKIIPPTTATDSGSSTTSQGRPSVHPFFHGKPMLPQYPPGLMPPPGANIPPLPPQFKESEEFVLPPSQPAVTSSQPPKSTPTTAPVTKKPPVTPNIPPVPTTPEDRPTKPNYPPHLLNSNTNNHRDNSTTLPASSDDGVSYNPNPNDIKDLYPELPTNALGSAQQTDVNETLVNSKNSGDGSSTNNIIIFTIVPIVVIFGVVPIVVASIWLVRRRTRVKKRPTKEMRKESALSATTTNSSMMMSGETDSPNALKQWIKQAQSNRYESWNPDADPSQAGPNNRWEFPRHHLQIGGILGEGCFGQVWRCEALNIDGKEGTTTVAVKTLKESAGERERADLLSELAVMKMLDPHPHVVRLLGCCTEKDPLFLIMEFVALGKLQSYLRNSRAHHYYGNLHADSSSLSSKDLTACAYQVARGMEYLASKGIIHRDLAARNILIDKDRVCKVADFGFARDVVANHVYERKTDGRLPVRWMAPEALYDNIFTTKTDIWSFGVLMWEIVTLGSTPYPGMGAADVMRKVRDGYRLEKPEHCRRELYNIMFYCWAHNPDDRPTFADLVNFLKQLLFSETDYIELDRFPDHDYYNFSGVTGQSDEKL